MDRASSQRVSAYDDAVQSIRLGKRIGTQNSAAAGEANCPRGGCARCAGKRTRKRRYELRGCWTVSTMQTLRPDPSAFLVPEPVLGAQHRLSPSGAFKAANVLRGSPPPTESSILFSFETDFSRRVKARPADRNFGRERSAAGLHASRDSFYRTARSERQHRSGVIPLAFCRGDVQFAVTTRSSATGGDCVRATMTGTNVSG